MRRFMLGSTLFAYSFSPFSQSQYLNVFRNFVKHPLTYWTPLQLKLGNLGVKGLSHPDQLMRLHVHVL